MRASKKATILQLNLSSAWGGMEMSTLKMARQLKERGFESAVLTEDQAPLMKQAEAAGIRTFAIPKGGGHLAPKTSLALRQAILSTGAEMVMVHQLKNLWVLRPALWNLPKVRVVGFARMFLKDISKRDLLHRYVYARMEKLVALNNIQRDAILPCLPLPASKYVVIPNGVDTTRFHPSKRSDSIRRKDFGGQDGELVVGVVGRIDPQKGQLEFIEAAAALLKRFPRTRFVLIGEETIGEGGWLGKLKDRAAELKVPIVFLGHRNDTPEIMASLDIVVVPSYEEAFGNVTIEGMASGRPVVGTNSGGTPTLISSDWGALVNPQDSLSLAEGIARYLENPSLIEQHGRRAREIAESKYSLSVVIDQIEKQVIQQN